MSILTDALRYRNQDFITIPCHPGSKKPAIAWARWQGRLPSSYQVVKWFAKGEHNLALLLSGNQTILDFDKIYPYHKWKYEYPDLADTYTVRSSRGYHVYFTLDKPTPIMALDGIDILGARHLITAPPSIHPSGIAYRVVVDAPIMAAQSLNDVIEWEQAAECLVWRESPVLPKRRLACNGDSLIAKTKWKLPLLELLSWFTFPVRSSQDGRWWIMRCPHPSHIDKSPSFWCDAVREKCGCFKPSCRASHGGRAMDQFNLYGWLMGLDNGDAIAELAREASCL